MDNQISQSRVHFLRSYFIKHVTVLMSSLFHSTCKIYLVHVTIFLIMEITIVTGLFQYFHSHAYNNYKRQLMATVCHLIVIPNSFDVLLRWSIHLHGGFDKITRTREQQSNYSTGKCNQSRIYTQKKPFLCSLVSLSIEQVHVGSLLKASAQQEEIIDTWFWSKYSSNLPLNLQKETIELQVLSLEKLHANQDKHPPPLPFLQKRNKNTSAKTVSNQDKNTGTSIAQRYTVKQ